MTTPIDHGRPARRKADIAGIYPLTVAQQGMLFHSREDGQGTADPYFSQDVLVLEGALNPALLEDAWRNTVARHDILRSDFRWEGIVTPVRILFRDRPVRLHLLDWRDCADPDTRLAHFRAERRKAGFDFAHAADPDLTLAQVGEDRWFLIWAYHHVAVDGWSYALVMQDLLTTYRARCDGIAAPLLPAGSFQDYVAWLKRQDTAAAEDYWRGALCAFDGPMALPWPPPAQTPAVADRWAEVTMPLDGEGTGQRLAAFIQRERITLSTLCQGMWAIVLGRLAGTSQVSFGITVAGRPADLSGAERIAGLFINSLPFTTQIADSASLGDWLRALQDQNAVRSQFDHVPLARIQALAGRSGQSLFDSLLVVENFPVDAQLLGGAGALRVTPWAPADHGLPLQPRTAAARNNYPLTLVVVPGERPQLLFAYDRASLSDDNVRAMAQAAGRLLDSMIRTTDGPVGALSLTGPVGQGAMDLGDGGPAPSFVSLPQQVADSAVRQPDAIALRDEHGVLSYAGLEARSSALAAALKVQGVGPDVRVALLAERGIAYVVGLLATMKAGAAFLPLDASQPLARLQAIVEDADPLVLLAQDVEQGVLVAGGRTTWSTDHREEEVTAFAAPLLHPAQAAYVIYTSGSTGTPKGVVVTHGGLAQYTAGLLQRLSVSRDSRFAMVSTIAADLGHTTVFGALASGGTLCLLPGRLAFDPDGFAQWMRSEAVDVLKIVPGHLGGLMAATEPALPRSALILGGEPASPVLIDRLRALAPGVRIFNHYGPTETTVGVLTHRITVEVPADGLPLGRPLAGCRIRLCDPMLHPLPAGLPGEMLIGGGSLAQGYLGRPGLTAAHFVPDPDRPGERLYRSGDRAEWMQDGTVRFLGRVDDQVKIRGYRVEPGELAAQLRSLSGVQDAAVILRDGRLLAYVTPAACDTGALREELARRLPEPLLPAALIALGALPLTPNGKLDRRALPDPAAVPEPDATEMPRSPVEARLAEIWTVVLGRDTIGIHDNFFDLGGDSILNLQIIARARRAGLRITPRQIFEHQTIARLAQVTEAMDGETKPSARPVMTPALMEAPLTPIQADFLERKLPEARQWNQSLLLELHRPVAPEEVEAALRHLVARHPALRFRFAEGRDGWRQRAADMESAQLLDVHDVAGQGDAEALEDIYAAANHILQRSLDPVEGPVFRGALIVRGAEPAWLLLAAHHLVIDSVSWRILLTELPLVIEALQAGQTPRLPSIPGDYAQWAARLARHAAERLPELPLWLGMASEGEDEPSPSNLESAAKAHWIRFDRLATARLMESASTGAGGRSEELLLTALAQALCAWRGTASVTVELEGHGREPLFGDIDMSHTVGWFTCRYPVRLSPAGQGNDAVTAIADQLRAVPGKGLGHGLLRHLDGNAGVRAAMRSVQRPSVTFNYLGRIDLGHGDGWMRLLDRQPVDTRGGCNPRSHLIDVDAHVADGCLSVVWTYCPAVHDGHRIAALVEGFENALLDLLALAPSMRTRTFPLASLTDAQADRIVSDTPGLEDVLRLAPLQAGLLYETLAEGGDGLYVNQLCLGLSGPLQPEPFVQAWRGAIAAHAILRTIFQWEGLDEPHQLVLRTVDLPVTMLDWRHLAPPEAEAALTEWLATDMAAGFAPDVPPLMRLALIEGADGWRVIWTRHHLLLDGWSSARLLGEVFNRYAAVLQGLPPALPDARQYRDHIDWLSRRDHDADTRFWRDQLSGMEAPSLLQRHAPGLPETVEAGRYETGRMGRHRLDLGEASSAVLAAMARNRRVTLNTLVQAAWVYVLSRHCRQRDVLFGITVSGRPLDLPGAEDILGLFINTLPIRVRLPADLPLADWWQRLQQQNLDLREHEQAQLADLKQLAGIEPATPLFDTLLVFENYPIDKSAADDLGGGLRLTDVRAQETLGVPLTLIAYPDEAIGFELVYRRDCFSGADVACFAEQLRQTLEQFAGEPEQAIGQLSLSLREEGQEQAQDIVTAERRDTLVSRFVAQAAVTPDAVALTAPDRSLTYGELDKASDRMARKLVEEGIGGDTPVALCLDRTASQMVAILAVLKAGGCYVPLDPAAPMQRLRLILEDCGASCLIHDGSLTFDGCAIAMLHVDDLCDAGADDAGLSVSIRLPGVVSQQLAYIIYTSGSTGRPKGVPVTHANVLRLFDAARPELSFNARDVWTIFHSYAFDFSVWEIWGAWLHGGRAVLVSQQVARDQYAFLDLLCREGVTVLNQTPSAFYKLAEVAMERHPDWRLREVIFGGEALDPRRLAGWFARFGDARPRLVNMYGITETTVHVTVRPLAMADTAAGSEIGRPLADLSLHLLDDALQPVAVGMTGEIYVGGAGLAPGYLNRPGLSAERFIADPFGREPGSRLYRSGDLGRRLPDGGIEYRGRSDQQIKLRGFRIEPGEIEAMLCAHPAVREASVLLRTDEDRPSLLACIAGQEDALDEAELRRHAQSLLPDYMVPARFLFVDALPLTVNGKIDSRALIGLATAVPRPPSSDLPRDALEEAIAAIWGDMLGLDGVGVHENFFALGGHSLLATRTIARTREATGVALRLADLFSHPTVAGQAELVRSAPSRNHDRELAVMADLLEEMERL